VLVAGGSSGTGYLSSVDEYDPSSGTWSAAASLAAARGLHTATLLADGRVLVAGGVGAGSVYIASAELYDPAHGAWSSAGGLTDARGYDTATLLGSGNVLVAGGWNGSSSLASTERFDPGYDATAPRVTGASPGAAPVGKRVTITGTHLAGTLATWFGGVPSAPTGGSGTLVTTKVPNGALTGELVVLTPSGLRWAPSPFRVKPHIGSFGPASGPPGTKVTLMGTAFTGATKVQFNGKSVPFSVNSYTKIVATVLVGTTTGRIRVATPGGKGKSKTDFTVT
jgi:hypothetical protein